MPTPKSKAMGLSSPAKRRKATLMIAKRAMEKELEKKKRENKRDWKSDERQRKKLEAEAKRIAEEGRKVMQKLLEKVRKDIEEEQKRAAGARMLNKKRAEVKVGRAKRRTNRRLQFELLGELEEWEGREEGCEAGALSGRIVWETSESE